MTGPTVELLTEQLTTAWLDWDRACTALVERCKKERYRPGARDLAAQAEALIAAEKALAELVGVPATVLHEQVLTHRRRDSTPGTEWIGRPATRVHSHGSTGLDAPSAVLAAVLELAPDAEVDEFPTPNEHRRAS